MGSGKRASGVVAACAAALLLSPGVAPAKPGPPKTAPGFPRCVTPIAPSGNLPRGVGELLEYDIELMGVSLGTARIETARHGLYHGVPVTEYRGWVQPSAMVSALVRVDARISNVIPETAYTPSASLLRYTFRGDHFTESQSRSSGGKQLLSRHDKNGTLSTDEREFSTPVHDYLSAFILLRRLPRGAHGCTIIYAQRRAFTVWIEPNGTERLSTPTGERTFERFVLRYTSDRSKQIRSAQVWMTLGAERIPYQIQSDERFAPIVRLKYYQPPH